jgi:hypothetical protein
MTLTQGYIMGIRGQQEIPFEEPSGKDAAAGKEKGVVELELVK